MSIKLYKVIEKDYEQIYSLVTKKSNVSHFDDGEIWTEKKLDSFMLNCNKNPDFCFKIKYDKEFSGIVWIKKIKGKSSISLILEQKLKTLENLLKILSSIRRKGDFKELYINIRQDDKKLNKLLENNCYFNKTLKLGENTINRYIIFFRKNTYMIKTSLVSTDFIEKDLNKRGIWKKFDPNLHKNPDFIYVDGTYDYDKRLYKYKSYLKNLISNNFLVTEKYRLANEGKISKELYEYNLETYIFIPRSHFLPKYKSLFDGRKWIVKRNLSFSGKDIGLFVDYEKFVSFILPYEAQEEKTKKYDTFVIQEYITNPLLFKKKKFHIRLPFTVFDHKVLVPNKYLLFTAKDDYINGDWKNKKIHDSHSTSTDGHYTFQEDLKLSKKDRESIEKQITEMLKKFGNIEFKCYNDDDRCFMIFGADIMITDDYQIKLIEINKKIGKTVDMEESRAFWEEYTLGELYNVVDSVFPPKNKQKNNKFLNEIK
jgi:hypothetical protein